MAFKIKPHTLGYRTWKGAYAEHHDIRAYLGLGGISKLPIDFEARITVPLNDGRVTDLYCVKGHTSLIGRRGKSSKHRCFAVYPDCGAHVPAGRTHQHKCK
jgi:hypothetical protein